MLLGFLQIGTSEMLFIVFVALLLFGGKKLPELARGLGKGIREFKDASESIKREISDQINSFEKDLEIENPVLDDAEIDRQRKLAKAEADKQPKQLEEGSSSIENSDEGVEVKEVTSAQQTTESQEASLPDAPVQTYKDPRMQAIFTAPAGTYTHHQGREPDYESNPGGDDSKNQA